MTGSRDDNNDRLIQNIKKRIFYVFFFKVEAVFMTGRQSVNQFHMRGALYSDLEIIYYPQLSLQFRLD